MASYKRTSIPSNKSTSMATYKSTSMPSNKSTSMTSNKCTSMPSYKSTSMASYKSSPMASYKRTSMASYKSTSMASSNTTFTSYYHIALVFEPTMTETTSMARDDASFPASEVYCLTNSDAFNYSTESSNGTSSNSSMA